jgi:hypothetical protein
MGVCMYGRHRELTRCGAKSHSAILSYVTFRVDRQRVAIKLRNLIALMTASLSRSHRTKYVIARDRHGGLTESDGF